jgi:hypothetical protein
LDPDPELDPDPDPDPLVRDVDPDPHQNVTDSQDWTVFRIRKRRIRQFLALPDPDPPINKQKN